MTVQRIQRVAATAVVCYFVAFTAVCWFLDLAFPGKLATQTRVGVAFEVGVVGGFLTVLCSLSLWRSRRWLAITGLVACVLWAVWIPMITEAELLRTIRLPIICTRSGFPLSNRGTLL